MQRVIFFVRVLRANRIPAGLCYQRLSVDGDGAPYCLHGLNAVYLPDSDWYRLDARGNRDGIDAQFAPPVERLAFCTNLPGEHDLPGIYSTPLPMVVDSLRRYSTWDALYNNLPDVANFGGVSQLAAMRSREAVECALLTVRRRLSRMKSCSNSITRMSLTASVMHSISNYRSVSNDGPIKPRVACRRRLGWGIRRRWRR